MTAGRRAPAVAGTFYPSDPAALRALVQEFLDDAAGPAPDAAPGVIAPHAGLVYSGACAARVFRRVTIPDTVVILAPNHTGRVGAPNGASVWARGTFATPLGEVPIAEGFAARLLERTALAAHDPVAHEREHAIEVELPFLQMLAPAAAIVPIVLAHDGWPLCRELGAALADVIAGWETAVLIVASSDMTHYEPADRAAARDGLALAEVERLDGAALLDVCRRTPVTMCGRAPAAAALEACRLRGARAAEVVDYRHSGQVTGDHDRVVAYAGVVIR